MADLTPEQAIDQLRKLPEDKQRLVLGKLTPDVRKGILSKLTVPDVTAPISGQGTYAMTDKSGKTVGISYGNVNAASQLGWKMTNPAVMRKYVTDTAADPNINTLPKGGGTRIVGRNAAGQPILAPEEPGAQESGPVSRVLSSLGQAVGGAAKGVYRGLVEGPQTPEEGKVEATPVTGPIDLRIKRFLTDPMAQQAQQATSEFKQAVPTSLHPTQEQLWHRQRAAGHALAAAIPGVGPWAAQVGEQAATQYATGNVAGAAGTLAGNAALYAAPHLVRGAAELGRPVVRSTVEALTNTGPRELRKMAEETVKANNEAAAKAAAKNAANAQKHLEQTQEALHKTRGAELETDTANREARLEALRKEHNAAKAHQTKVEEVRQHNQRVLEERTKRQQAQQKLDTASQNLQKKIETARTKAKAADDAAWDKWRDKVGTAEAPSGEIVDQINASKSTMDPEDVAEFRKVLKETKPTGEDVSELQSTRDNIAKQNGLGESYDKASPENKKAIDEIVNRLGLDLDETEAAATTPVTAARLHVWKTQLEYAVRNATRGNVRYGLGQVLDKVRDTENKLSEAAGAGAELATARELHGPYKDTFVNPPGEPRTVASTVQAKVAPEFTKEAGLTEQIQMLGNYDPSIPKLASHIDNLRQGLSALPKEAPLREQIQIPPARPEPGPQPKLKEPERTAPPERPAEVEAEQKTIGPEEIRARREANIGTAAEKRLREQGVRRAINALYYTAPTAVLSTLLGHPGYALTEVAMSPVILAGSHALANLFDRPEVVNWIAKVTPRDVAAFEKLPPEQKAVFSQNLRQLVTMAQQRGTHISPALTAFVAGSAAAAKTPKTLKEIREEAQRRQSETQNAQEPVEVTQP